MQKSATRLRAPTRVPDLADLPTLEEAALFQKLSRYTLYRMASSGRILPMKAGRQWRFSQRDLYEWLRTNAKAK